MTIPEFIRFYGYTVEQVLNEYAVTFYALVNDMYSLQAKETISLMYASNPTEELVGKLREQEKGVAGLVNQVKLARSLRK